MKSFKEFKKIDEAKSAFKHAQAAGAMAEKLDKFVRTIKKDLKGQGYGMEIIDLEQAVEYFYDFALKVS